MKHYEPSKPRTAIAMTAVAMTAISIGALVVLPAKLDFAGADPFAMAAAEAATMAPIGVAISATRVDVPEMDIPKEHFTSAVRLASSKHCAGNVKNRARAAQAIPNIPARSFNAQDRAIGILVLTKERP
jgi:hypothetical protein